MPEKPTTGAQRVRAAAAAVAKLREHYNFGRNMLDRVERKGIGVADVVRAEGERRNVHPSTVRKEIEFARAYTEAQFEQLAALRTPAGMPLSFGHVRYILAAGNPAARHQVARQAVAMNASVRDIPRLVQKRRGGGKKSQGGRPLRPVGSMSACLASIDRWTANWLVRHERAWVPALAGPALAATPGCAEDLAAARQMLKRLAKAASALHGELKRLEDQLPRP
jgi:hypothetical protein